MSNFKKGVISKLDIMIEEVLCYKCPITRCSKQCVRKIQLKKFVSSAISQAVFDYDKEMHLNDAGLDLVNDDGLSFEDARKKALEKYVDMEK